MTGSISQKQKRALVKGHIKRRVKNGDESLNQVYKSLKGTNLGIATGTFYDLSYETVPGQKIKDGRTSKKRLRYIHEKFKQGDIELSKKQQDKLKQRLTLEDEVEEVEDFGEYVYSMLNDKKRKQFGKPSPEGRRKNYYNESMLIFQHSLGYDVPKYIRWQDESDFKSQLQTIIDEYEFLTFDSVQKERYNVEYNEPRTRI